MVAHGAVLNVQGDTRAGVLTAVLRDTHAWPTRTQKEDGKEEGKGPSARRTKNSVDNFNKNIKATINETIKDFGNKGTGKGKTEPYDKVRKASSGKFVVKDDFCPEPKPGQVILMNCQKAKIKRAKRAQQVREASTSPKDQTGP